MKLFGISDTIVHDCKGFNISRSILSKCDDIQNKYPEKNLIYYKTIKLKDKIIYPSVKLQDFITPMYSHYKWCKDNKLTIEDFIRINKENDNKYTMEELLDSLRFQIFKKYARMKSYQCDSKLYGVPEMWESPLNIWYIKQGDCESSSLSLLCLFKAAGFNNDLEHLNWAVCGDTKYGGHCVVHIYSLVKKKWYHLETTKTKIKEQEIKQLPEIHDESNPLCITDIWFSFNSQLSRATEVDGNISIRG